MPLPNFHSCRVREPGLYKKNDFKTLQTKTKGLTIIVGVLKSTNKSALQSYRYDKKVWNNDRASKHCGGRGGKFEGATTKKLCGVIGDHSFLHLIWSKVKKDKEWGGWSQIELIKEHARLVDDLRRKGHAMHPKTVLDSLSREYEETVQMLTPSDIPGLLQSGGNTIFQQPKKKKDVKLEDSIFLGNLKSLDDITRLSDVVCLLQSTSEEKHSIEILIRMNERNIRLENKIIKQFPENVRDTIEFTYDVSGPSESYVPLFDLVLRPKELKIIKLENEVENK